MRPKPVGSDQEQPPPSQQLPASVVALQSCPSVSLGWLSEVRERSNGFASSTGIGVSGSTNFERGGVGGLAIAFFPKVGRCFPACPLARSGTY